MGIGTTTPAGHVPSRKSLILADTSNDALLELWGASAGKMFFQSVGGNTHFGSLAKGTGNGDLSVTYGDGAVGIFIQGSDGSVGFGTQTPGQNLDIAGSLRVSDMMSVGTNSGNGDLAVPIRMYQGDGTNPRAKLAYWDIFKPGGADLNRYYRLVGNLNAAGESQYVQVLGSAGWINGCSRKIKHDIRPLTDEDYTALKQEYDKVPLYSYVRDGDATESTEVGFIAEDTPAIMGSTGDGISYMKSIGFLAIMAKYQNNKIKLLKQKIDQLNKLVSK
jgi:hypothetical protein